MNDLKEGCLGKPKQYLGTRVYTHSLPNGAWVCAMSFEKFIKNAVKTVDQLLLEDGEEYHLKTMYLVPFPISYNPELDFSEELDAIMTIQYRQLIGLLRWGVELGRLDIF